MKDTLLRANQRQQFRLRVQVDIIPTLVETSHCLTQLRGTHRRLIAMGIGLVSHLTEFLDGLLGGRHVRTAYGKTDNILTLRIELGDFFQFTTEIILTD